MKSPPQTRPMLRHLSFGAKIFAPSDLLQYSHRYVPWRRPVPKPTMMKRLFKKKGVTKDETPPAATAAVGVTPVEVEVGVAPSTSASEKKLSLKSKEKSSSSGSSAKHDKEHRKKKKEHRSKSKKNDGEKQRSKFI